MHLRKWNARGKFKFAIEIKKKGVFFKKNTCALSGISIKVEIVYTKKTKLLSMPLNILCTIVCRGIQSSLILGNSRRECISCHRELIHFTIALCSTNRFRFNTKHFIREQQQMKSGERQNGNKQFRSA
jgi:hypothetical protein